MPAERPKLGKFTWILLCLFISFVLVVIICALIFFLWGNLVKIKPPASAAHQALPQCATSTDQFTSKLAINCDNIGLDGAPLDAALRRTTRTDPVTGQQLKFDQFAKDISEINIYNDGNVTISDNALTCCPNLTSLKVSSSRLSNLLSINPNEFVHTPKLTDLTFGTLTLANSTLDAVASLKDRLLKLVLKNTEPHSQLLNLLPTFTKLSYLNVTGLCADTTFPTNSFKGSAASLNWIVVDNCTLPKVTADMFKGMENLYYLKLVNNNITTVEPKAFDDLVSLTELNLKHNNLTSLPDNLFFKIKNTTFIDLSDNIKI